MPSKKETRSVSVIWNSAQNILDSAYILLVFWYLQLHVLSAGFQQILFTLQTQLCFRATFSLNV